MSDLPAIAAIITATTAGVALILMRITALIREVRLTAEKVDQIDHAVNGKPPGATTMVSQVQQLHDDKFPSPNGDAVLPLLRQVAADVAALKKPTKPPKP